MSHSYNIVKGIAEYTCSDYYYYTYIDTNYIKLSRYKEVRITLPNGTIIK